MNFGIGTVFVFRVCIHSPTTSLAMFRSLLTLALSLVMLAEASAQTAPAAASKATVKSAKATARTSRRAAKKARRMVAQAAAAPSTTDGWPAPDDAQTAVASTATTGVAYGAPATSARNGNIDLAYAGPGMPVHIRTTKEAVPYSVRPARKPASSAQNTLGN